jgi:Domain of unknown function (DUF4062)
MEKRFQVFVSSTYQDLQEERQEVMHALLELDCIPSGMELFPAANETQWSLIKRVIDECDYYVLIIGGRYGSIGSEGISYTEMEYRYALSIDKPTIAFLHETPGLIPSNKSETSDEGREKLEVFRKLIREKLCKSWSNPSELGSVVSRSLVQLIKNTPAVGWVRANELPDREATLELLRLRKRVDELETELQRVRTTPPQGTENLAQGAEEFLIGYSLSFGLYPRENLSATFKAAWNNIFAAVAPLMIHEVSERRLKSAFDAFVEARIREEAEQELENPGNFRIDESDFQTIKIQLRALGLIIRSEKTRSVKDVDTYWTLTPYGDDLMTRLRAIKRSPILDEPQQGHHGTLII